MAGSARSYRARSYPFCRKSSRAGGAIMIEHEEADRRRQIALVARGVDSGDELRKRSVADRGYLLQRIPERVLEADAGLVTGNDDRAFDHRAFHASSPVLRRRPSRSRARLIFSALTNSRSA